MAKLFEDQVNTFPFWLNEVDTDIKREPEQAFEQEQERKRKNAEDDLVVGSLFGARASPSFRASHMSPANMTGSPAGAMSARKASVPAKSPAAAAAADNGKIGEEAEEADEADTNAQEDSPLLKNAGLSSLFPSFSTSRYARKKDQKKIQLPPGIRDPGVWIKDQGPVKVEAKVWLANQRTFVKWQHVGVLLASLSLGLYNAAGENNKVAQTLAIVYTLVAIFTLVWGYGVYMWRNRLIRERSGKDFDSIWGPLVVCVGLVVALCLNFAFKVRTDRLFL